MRRKIDPGKIRELYLKGYSDGRIAKELNISTWSVRRYRRILGLPAQYKFGSRPRRIDLEKLKALYYSGLSYEEIAEKVGTTKNVINFYVSKYKLSKCRKNRDLEIKQKIFKILNEKIYATSFDLAKIFNRNDNTIRQHLKSLIRRNLIKRFRINASIRNAVKFVEPLKFRKNEILYYVDEERFIEFLAKHIDFDLKNKTVKYLITTLLKNNGWSDEQIKLFYKIKASEINSLLSSSSSSSTSKRRERGG